MLAISGTKRSLKGLVQVTEIDGVYAAFTQCTPTAEAKGKLQVIYQDGKFKNQTTLSEVREKISRLSEKNINVVEL